METLLGVLLANAILVCLLALVVTIVDVTVRRPALAHSLWVLLLIKLLTPPLQPISLGSHPTTGAEAVSPAPADPQPQPPTPATRPPAPSSGHPAGDSGGEAGSYPQPVQPMVLSVAQWVPARWPAMAAAVWLTVSASWVILVLVRLGRAVGCLRLAAEAPGPLQQRTRELAGRMGMEPRRAPRVWMIPGAMSPLLWAIGGAPRLLIPGDLWDRLDPVKQDALLVHELAHLRRRDHWVRVLEMVVASLYWWCPAVWWVRRALHDAEERCCDAWVLWTMPDAARAYAAALLDTVDFLAESSSALPLGASGLWQVRHLRGRLAWIMRGGLPRGLSRSGAAAVFGVAFVMVPLTPPAFSARTFRVTDLGTLGGPTSYPQRINNLGQVAGFSMRPSGEYHAFRTAPDQPINPATDDIGGPYGVVSTYTDDPGDGLGVRRMLSQAYYESPIAINDSGKVVGEALVEGAAVAKVLASSTTPGLPDHPEAEFLGELGPTPEGGPPSASPKDINARGQVVGVSSRASSWSFHGFRTAVNRPIDPATDDLGTLGGEASQALAVNNSGQVTGISDIANGQQHAFRTAPDRPINPATDDLGSFGRISYGYAINDAGQVAGWSEYLDGDHHAFRTAPGRPINPATDDLGTLGGRESYGWAMNNSGHVVGRSGRPASFLIRGTRVGNTLIPPSWRAFLHDGKRMFDLNALISPGSGWVLYEAKDINDRGQIIGNGICPEGKLHGFLLTPVPEPGQVVLLGLATALSGLGFAWLGARGAR